ncbi:MAG: hypothetical protein ACFFDN_52740 [Candidatus Hodarchaeota archaeon]
MEIDNGKNGNNKDNNLYNILEKILFNEESLNKLKTAINDLSKGQMSSKKFRTQLIENRVKILEKLLEFLPFYLRQKTNVKSLDEFVGNDSEKNQLSKELQERNELLEEIGLRVNNIFDKLKEKIDS